MHTISIKLINDLLSQVLRENQLIMIMLVSPEREREVRDLDGFKDRSLFPANFAAISSEIGHIGSVRIIESNRHEVKDAIAMCAMTPRQLKIARDEYSYRPDDVTGVQEFVLKYGLRL